MTFPADTVVPFAPAAPAAPAPHSALADRQGRVIDYLRVSVTDRCNYRCTYCMPEDGVDHARRSDILSFEEIVDLVRCFVRVGVRRVRITGGEPTVRRDLVTLVELLAAIPGVEDLALSTNGHVLDDLAGPLRRAGLSRLNVSIDSLDPEKFARITRRGDLGDVLRGLAAARQAGFTNIKINTVAIKGFNDGEVGALCRYAFANGFVPRFIEQMPMAAGELYVPGTLFAAAEIRAAVLAAFPGTDLVPDDGIVRSGAGAGPARYWRLQRRDRNGGAADNDTPLRVGIISPMTEHFCDTCNRVRLSSAGALHSCLAHDDAVDLRGPLRAGGPDAVVARIFAAVGEKRDGHLFQVSGLGGPRKAMIQIGG